MSDLFFLAKCIYGDKVLAEGQKIIIKNCRECHVSFFLIIWLQSYALHFPIKVSSEQTCMSLCNK